MPLPLGKLRRSTRKKSGGTNAGSAEAELMASRSTALRLRLTSNDSGDDLSSTGSPSVEERHRLSLGSSASAGSLMRGFNNEETDAGGSHKRRHSVNSSSGSGSGSSGRRTSNGHEGKGKRRASLFASGADGGEARVVRVFFRDETYRSVRFMEEENCEEVLERLWPRLDLEGDRHDYKFYIVYRKEGNRFVNDDESADVLLGSDWMEVQKIYIRHKDDTAAAKRVVHGTRGSAEVVLKKSKSKRESFRGSAAPNPFTNVTGDSHTVHVESERPLSKFAQVFSQAWDNAEMTELHEERSTTPASPPLSPVKFDSVRQTVSTTSVAAHLKNVRSSSLTDSGRGSLDRKAEKTTAGGDDVRHRRSVSSVTTDSGVSLHQADLESPALPKTTSRTSIGSGSSPRSTARVTHYSHSSLSKLSFAPVDVNIGHAPAPPVAPKSVISPASHYSIPSAHSYGESPPPSPLPPPPPDNAKTIPLQRTLPLPSPPPSPTPSLPPPPTAEELGKMSRTEFSFQLNITVKSDGLHC